MDGDGEALHQNWRKPMSDRSGIEWTDATWNPVTGCTKVSPGCAHCYAERITLRFRRGPEFLPGKAEIKVHPDRLDQPIRWRRPRRVFVCSMSDLFHDEVPIDYIDQVLCVMRQATHHTFQVLTKRPGRLLSYTLSPAFTWPPHIWVGTSVENQYWVAMRLPYLLTVPAAFRFVSVEPLLKAVDLRPYLHGLDWVIVGGESGPRARPMDPKWVRDIRDACLDAGVAFFFKQWGGPTPKAGGRDLDGRTWDEMPSGQTTRARGKDVL